MRIRKSRSRRRQRMLVFTMILLTSALGCTSGHSSAASNDPVGPKNPLQRQIDGGSYCVQVMTQGPPVSAPLHFSNKAVSSDGSSKDYESDLFGDNLDLAIRERRPATDMDRELDRDFKGKSDIKMSIKDGFVESEQKNHYKRADAQGWSMGANSVVLGASPWALFVSKPIVTKIGTETIGGYETIKYSVDTTHQSELDKWPANQSWGTKDYNISGSAWVSTSSACILQYQIDIEKDQKNGEVIKTHYEGTVAKQ